MKKLFRLQPALALMLGVICAGVPLLRGQSESAALGSKPAAPEEMNQAELLKSYLQLRDQLEATQVAIATTRVEAENAARAQAVTIAQKLEAITAAMEAERVRHRMEMERSSDERERYRAEALRLNSERERQQTGADATNRMTLFIAALFGVVGLISLLLTPLFQWRTLKRLTQLAEGRSPLAAASTGLLSDNAVALADKAVAQSNQQLLLAIDRIERRIGDFEQSATAKPLNGAGRPGLSDASAVAANNHEARFSVLLAKGQALYDSGKPIEALSCYNEILRQDINHPEALVKRGAALEKLKQDEEAIQCYDRAILSDRTMTLAYLHKGAVCNRLERYEEAVKCYEQALLVEAGQ